MFVKLMSPLPARPPKIAAVRLLVNTTPPATRLLTTVPPSALVLATTICPCWMIVAPL